MLSLKCKTHLHRCVSLSFPVQSQTWPISKKPAHDAICIDTSLAAKFRFFFFYHTFPQKSLRARRKCRVAQVRGGKRVCLCYGFGLWREGYVQTSPGSESTETRVYPRIIDMHLTECLSFIHLFISGICACYTTGKVFCDDVFIFSVWVLPVAIKLVRVPDSSWLHCLH